MPNRVLGLPWQYSCRDAWHTPAAENAEWTAAYENGVIVLRGASGQVVGAVSKENFESLCWSLVNQKPELARKGQES